RRDHGAEDGRPPAANVVGGIERGFHPDARQSRRLPAVHPSDELGDAVGLLGIFPRPGGSTAKRGWGRTRQAKKSSGGRAKTGLLGPQVLEPFPRIFGPRLVAPLPRRKSGMRPTLL